MGKEKNLQTILRDCLETRGYEVTEEKLAELYGIYENCQEWDDGEMLTGQSYDEVEDFVKHSPCVDEVFQKPVTLNKYYEVNDGWFTYYVNCETKEKKFELNPGDIKVDRKLDDFCRGRCCQ